MRQWMNSRNLVGWSVATALVAHLLLWLEQPLLVPAVAALVLTGLLPGWLFVAALYGPRATLSLGERILYAIGSGYGVMVTVMLLVSYLPGGVQRWQTLLAFDLTLAVLLFVIWRQRRGSAPPQPQAAEPIGENPPYPQTPQTILLVALAVLLLLGGFFRLANLGYSEFQGDEARAALRAAGVIQGYEDVLLIHKKGPTEILLPTVIYSLTGHLNEQTARLPFALAGLSALFAVFLLGWRLLGPVAGWAAAFLLVFDGYLIGFSHIVQYQSVVLLLAALVVQIAHRLYSRPTTPARDLTLMAFMLATGILSHYEAVAAALPAFFLLGAALYQRRMGWRTLSLAAIPGLLTGGALLAAFYVPFVLHPNFSATYTYLVDRRFGGEERAPYNNLTDFFIRTTTYNSIYFAVTMIVLVVIALLWAYRRGLAQPWANLASAAVVGVLAFTFWRPEWLRFGEIDLIIVPFAAAFVLVWLLPRLRAEERALWLWFGAPLLLAFFLTSKPRSHVYIFFTPWALLGGMVIAMTWRALQQRMGQTVALAIGGVATVAAAVVFGFYVYWFFVHNQVEVLRTWRENRPAGYWVPYDEPDDKAIFGFPLANGWKVVGALYEQGVIQGDYETNEKEAWVPSWYTRGQLRCGRTADWYFQIHNLEPFNDGDFRRMEHFLRSGFEKWAKVEINGADRMMIYKNTGARLEFPTEQPTDGLQTFALNDFRQAFDLIARPTLTLTYPSVAPPIGNPLRANFNDQLWLEGYDIRYQEPLRAGDNIHLTLYWRAQEPIPANYKVFNQSYYGDGVMVAQLDGYPVCETRETWRWDPGELITDEYVVPVNPEAPDGLYPLYTGMYVEETMERIPVMDEAGNPVATQAHLTDIRIGVE